MANITVDEICFFDKSMTVWLSVLWKSSFKESQQSHICCHSSQRNFQTWEISYFTN